LFFQSSKEDVAGGDRHHPACPRIEQQQAIIINSAEVAGNRTVRQIHGYLFANTASDIAPAGSDIANTAAAVPRS